ncbi:hypothetical protein D3C79_1069200 [compost metagenome]
MSVSLDNQHSKMDWLAAIKQDRVPWTQISALEGMLTKSAVMYGIKYIPSNFLINPEGKIIARNLRGEDVAEQIGKLILENN